MHILGTSGRPMVELGGTHAWRLFSKGDIVASLQWVDLRAYGSDEDGPQPVLALYPSQRRTDTAAYVVPQSSAWAYADSRGRPTPHLLGTAFKAAVAMGFHPDKATVYRIVDVIVEAMPDLIRMPSTAPADIEAMHQRRPLGIEARAQVNGRTIQETVL